MSNNPTFEAALKFTLKWEGGFSDHPNDHGGKTQCGITQHTYDAYRKFQKFQPADVRFITKPEIDKIYKLFFWDAIHADELENKVAIVAFDWAVNSGPSRVNSYLKDKHDSADWLLTQRRQFLHQIGIGHNSEFLKGWLARVDDLEQYIKGVV